MPALTMADLVARAEITDVIHCYATGIDRRDWKLYRSIFTDEIDLDFSTWGSPAHRSSADAWAAGVRDGLSGFTATQHTLSNHVVTLRGGEATCVTYMQALHFLDVEGHGEIQSLGGYYTNHLRRTANGWKIYSCTLTVTWQAGDRGLFALARERWDRLQRSVPQPTVS